MTAEPIGDLEHAVETVAFPENHAGATFTMPGSTVVRMTTAIRCAEEFSVDLHQVEHGIRPTECSDLEVIAAVEPTTQSPMELLG